MKYTRAFIKQAVLLILIIFTAIGTLSAEYIFLKDGPIIDGKIINESQSVVTVRDKNNKNIALTRDVIIRIVYANLYLGKVTVRMANGKDFAGYVVEEDSENYTFRKNISRPEEFKLKRSEVLFIARRTPINLKGSADRNSINLEWNAPFNKIKKYKIFAKADDEKEFKLIGTIPQTAYKARALRSNLNYSFYVTAIDDQGDESLPGETIRVATQNIPPDYPKNLSLKKITDEKTSKMKVILKWDPSSDPDGKVTGYTIQRRQDVIIKPAGKTRETEFTINNFNPADGEILIVRAIDNNGAESIEVEASLDGKITILEKKSAADEAVRFIPHFSFGIQPLYAQPIRKFADITDMGFGASAYAKYNNFLFRGMNISLEAGYLFFSGAVNEVKSETMIPVSAALSYDIQVSRNLFLSPEASFGYSRNTMTRKKFIEFIGPADTFTAESAFEPFFSGGLSVSYEGFTSVPLTLGARYNGIIEKDGIMDFVTVYLSAGYRL